MPYITVCTPTYNRANLLFRPFQSLMQQTFKDFMWIVVDDGSTDNTEEVIEKCKAEAPFSIVYLKQDNKGRAAALNLAYQFVSSKYVVNLDSDDAYVPKALQIMHDIWESIPQEEYNRFWCITGQCIERESGKIIGGMWPEGINKLSGIKQHRVITKYKKGDKLCCRKTDVLKQYPFPQFEDTKFVPELMVWEKINLAYDQYCTNEIFLIVDIGSSDSLSRSRQYSITRKYAYYHSSIFLLNECFHQWYYNKTALVSIVDVPRLAILTKHKYIDTMKSINRIYKRAIVTLLWPLLWIFDRLYYQDIGSGENEQREKTTP